MRVDTEKMRALQEEMAKQISLDDARPLEEIQLVAGIDIAYHGNEAAAACVVMRVSDMAVVEKRVSFPVIAVPYTPGFLAFREGPAMCALLEQLEQTPDVVLVDGHGISHETKCGLATYIGLKMNIPTIGIAKQLLAGIVKDGRVILRNEHVGWEIVSREHARPIFASPGNRVSLATTKALVEKLLRFPHKMPEPLHIARRMADKKLRAKAFIISSEEASDS